MKIKFNINYNTQWGQTMCLLVYKSACCAEESECRYDMRCHGKSGWNVDISVENSGTVYYRYAISRPGMPLDPEFGSVRAIKLPEGFETAELFDAWRSACGESPFETAAFTECFFKRVPMPRNDNRGGNLVLQMHCPQVEPNRHLAIVGNQKELGNWDVSLKVRLDESQFPLWSITLDSAKIKFPLEYKYLLVDSDTDEVLSWDDGLNRRVDTAEKGQLTIVNSERFVRSIPSWKGAGVAIPVFSLRSEQSFGIGEFEDLKKMVDWVKITGQRIIQVLPVNDTILYHSNYDSYPYNALSVYALHPVYLHLESVGAFKSDELKESFRIKKEEFNALTFSDYQNVMSAKWEFIKILFDQESPVVFESEEYKTFFEANEYWLVPYAAFSYLRDLNGTPSFGNWKEYSVYNKQEIEALSAPEQPHYQKIAIYYFVQYHLHKQLVEVHEYARANGVVLKGDIPIGISPRSVGAWVNPELFNTHLQAGAPPDDFSAAGQNWGFPVYRWDVMEKDGYRWWKMRVRKMAEYFDAYRIDHILGFFRIWGIPGDAHWGLTGSFQPAKPFTREELEAKGLVWDEERYLKPYMREQVLYSVFGKYTDDVIHEFLLPDGPGNFKFRPEYDTQKKIEKHFSSLDYEFGTKEVQIRDGLHVLHCEVLFVRDMESPDRFHPRIAMHNSATFRNLPESTRLLLDKIYVDYFYHRHTEFWKQNALKRLPALMSATNMLVCGEDLGMVPDSVPVVMKELEILSLEIQRMPKKLNTDFAMPADAPYLSVCSTSTHDLNPIRAWWEEDTVLTQRFYNRALGLHGVAPATCEAWLARRIVEQHLQSGAMLAILPWQDWMAMDPDLCSKHPQSERINVPSDPRNFWCYRMHLTLEQLLAEDGFNRRIAGMIKNCGR